MLCSRCKRDLPSSAFYQSYIKRVALGERNTGICRECSHKYQQQYWIANKAKLRAKCHEYYLAHIPQHKERCRQYEEEHQEQIYEQRRQYRLRTRDKRIINRLRCKLDGAMHTVSRIEKRMEPTSKACELCGHIAKKLAYHHWGNVMSGMKVKGIWVCQPCHHIIEHPDDAEQILAKFRTYKSIIDSGGEIALVATS